MKFFACLLAFVLTATLFAETTPEKVQRGISLLNEGNVQAAEDVLQEVIRENPQHGPARLLLGQIAMEQTDWKNAQEHLQIAIVSNTRRPHITWQVYGKLQLLLHKHAEARRAFEASLKESPDFIPARMGHAQSALFLEDVEPAIADLQQAVTAHSPDAAFLLTELFLYLDRKEEARARLTGFQWKEPDQEARAKLLLKSLETSEESLDALRTAVGKNLGDAENYLALALRDRQKGASLFSIAFQLNDQNPVAYLFAKKNSKAGTKLPQVPYPEIVKMIALAQQALKDNQVDRAKDLAQQVLQDRPMHVPAELILIEVAEKKQDYWDALRHYQEIVQWLPEIPTIEARLAGLAGKMGASPLAECHIQKALRLEPQNGYFHYIFASVLKAKEQSDAALEEAERAISFGFQEAAAYLLLGDIHYEKMEISKSIAALGKAIEKDPHAAENIASFALTVLTTQDYLALRKILETHAKANPQNIETIYSLAMMYLNENDLQRAKEHFSSLERLKPNQSQIYYNLALVNYRLGQEQEGQKAMARFEELKQKERAEWLRHNGAHKMRLEAREAFQQGNISESIRLYVKLLSDGLAEIADLFALAKSYSQAKKHAEALDIFEKVLQQSPYNVDALNGAAEASKLIGSNDTAKLYGERAKMLKQPCM